MQYIRRGGNRKANDEFSRGLHVLIRGDALGRRKNLARRRLIGSVRARQKAGSVGLIIGRFPFFFLGGSSPGKYFRHESTRLAPTAAATWGRLVVWRDHGRSREAGGGGRESEQKTYNQPFSSVVKALLKIMERISRSTNFSLYTPRAHYLYRTPISSKTCRFFFLRPYKNLTRFDHRIFFPPTPPPPFTDDPVKGHPAGLPEKN